MHILKSFDKKDFEHLHLDVPSSVKSVKLMMVDNYSDFENSDLKSLFTTASDNYPDFYSWYYNKLMNGTLNNRKLFKNHYKNKDHDKNVSNDLLLLNGRLVLIAAINETLAGLSVLKRDSAECKISTFFIDDKFSKLGLGSLLLDCSLSFLPKEPVNITVSETALDKMTPFLFKKGFEEFKSVPGEYSPNKKETHFIKKNS